MTAMPPEHAEALAAALNGTGPAIVCYTRCVDCQFGYHYEPPAPHPWADDEDRAHAAATGQRAPDGNCGCWCAKTPDGAA